MEDNTARGALSHIVKTLSKDVFLSRNLLDEMWTEVESSFTAMSSSPRLQASRHSSVSVAPYYRAISSGMEFAKKHGLLAGPHKGASGASGERKGGMGKGREHEPEAAIERERRANIAANREKLMELGLL